VKKYSEYFFTNPSTSILRELGISGRFSAIRTGPGKFAKNRLRDNLIVAFHGSWNRTVPTGYKVVRIDTSDPQSKPVNFITGWLLDSGQAWGRPVEVKFFDDAMYVSDDRAGVIYKVVYN